MTDRSTHQGAVERRLRSHEPPAPPLPDDFAARLATRLETDSETDDGTRAAAHTSMPFGTPAWLLPAAVAATLLVSITAFVMFGPESPEPPAIVVDPPSPGTARLAALDLQEPLRAEANLIVDDVRRFSQRFRLPALLGGVDRPPPDPPADTRS